VATQVHFPVGDALQHGKVRKRVRDLYGNVSGHANNNSILDTRHYEVEFEDGTLGGYAAIVNACRL